jgi:hypothetical protein
MLLVALGSSAFVVPQRALIGINPKKLGGNVRDRAIAFCDSVFLLVRRRRAGMGSQASAAGANSAEGEKKG